MKTEIEIQNILENTEIVWKLFGGFYTKFHTGSLSELKYWINKLIKQNKELKEYLKLKNLNPLLDGFSMENFTKAETEELMNYSKEMKRKLRKNPKKTK